VAALLWNSFQSDAAAAAAPARTRDGGRWRLVFCYGLFGFGYIVPATFLPVMAKQAMGEQALFGWAWPVFGLAAAASTLAASRLARSMSARAIWIGGSVLMALGVAAPLYLPGVAGIALAALLVGSSFMVVTMAGMQEARRVAGAQARALMAAMTSAFALGQVIGPLTVGYFAGASGNFARPLLVAAGALALSAAALAQGPRPTSKDEP
jgi:predicted MFS family arabinose efflux permease